jgi:hypothetical protein
LPAVLKVAPEVSVRLNEPPLMVRPDELVTTTVS